MSSGQYDIYAIFSEAVARDSDAERAEFLDEACGDQQHVRDRVEALLNAHSEAGGFFGGKSLPPEEACLRPITEQPGDEIGPYKLCRQIGEGGMGIVFMAEQTEPVERRVALKIIKPGMDTRRVIARFEAERQALAMMDHPNIAKVLDAGTTDSGRPYFVMELVTGVSVTEYCDQQHLTPRERLELFVPICQAVQHAHQKGIIHRDLKPSNILVARYDDKAVPKVIDFGVAKAVSQKLAEKTMFTQYGQIVGTVEYMSPEQAQLSQMDVDTRSDIYSLGVLLYELLAGETPFDKQRLRSAAFDELLNIIREEEPPKPSTRLSSSGTLASIAANRKTEARRLSTLIRGELDWIVMKAMEKDRGRRYETAGAFATDVQHYLNGEAVAACPPSAAYRFRKFTQRNKVAIGTTAAVAAALIAGITGTTWQAYRATQAEGVATERLGIVESQKDEIEKERQNAIAEAERADREARLAREAESKAIAEAERANNEAAIAEAVNDFLNNDLLKMGVAASQVEAHITPDPDIKLRTLLDRAAGTMDDRFADQPLLEAEIRHTLGRTYRAIGAQKQAERQLQRALELRRREFGREHPKTLDGMYTLAWVYHDQGRYNEAEKLHQRVLEGWRRRLGDEHPATLAGMDSLADIYRHQGRYNEAEKLHRQTLEIRRRTLGDEHPHTLSSMNNLAIVYYLQGRHREAVKLNEQSLEIRRRILGEEHPSTLAIMNNLAKAYLNQGRLREAEQLHHRTLEIWRQLLGDEHPKTLLSISNLAKVYYAQQRHAEAEQLLQKTLSIQRRTLGDEHPHTLSSMYSLAKVYYAREQYAQAEQLQHKTLEIRRRVLGGEHPDTLHSMNNLAIVYLAQQRHAEAEQLQQQTLEILRRTLGDEHPQTLENMHNLANVYLEQKRHAEAEQLNQETLEIRRRVLGDEHTDTLLSMHNLAVVYDHQGRHAEAERLFRKTLEIQRRVLGDEHPATLQTTNNLAIMFTSRTWKLATAADPAERDPQEALRLAKLAVELDPNARHHSNLGVALYRDGQYEAAARAFEKADELKSRPDPYHRMFYAMTEWQLGHGYRALELYREIADWIRAGGIENEEQLRFRDEAEKLLGLSPVVNQNGEQPLKAPLPAQTIPNDKSQAWHDPENTN